MKSSLSRFTAAVAFVATSVAHAGDLPDAKAAILTRDAAPSRWRVGAAYAPIFGLETKFNGLGNFGTTFPVQPIAPGTSYEYDNGFVRVDSSGNAGGQTWNWGYDNAAQYDGGNAIAMSLTSSNANARAREDSDIAQGVDLFSYLDMGKISLAGKDTRWGLRAGLHYARVDIGNDSTLSAGSTTVRDTFTLATGGIVPTAPYSGSFGGPGPLLNDTPTRDILSGNALVAGSRDLDVHLATLSLGSYLEIPVTEEFHLMLEGGLNAALASGDYDFQSTTTIAGLGSVQSSGSASETKVLPGLYLGVSGTYQFDQNWALQLAGRYQYMDRFSLKDNGSEATLSFDSAFILSLGVLYSF